MRAIRCNPALDLKEMIGFPLLTGSVHGHADSVKHKINQQIGFLVMIGAKQK